MLHCLLTRNGVCMLVPPLAILWHSPMDCQGSHHYSDRKLPRSPALVRHAVVVRSSSSFQASQHQSTSCSSSTVQSLTLFDPSATAHIPMASCPSDECCTTPDTEGRVRQVRCSRCREGLVGVCGLVYVCAFAFRTLPTHVHHAHKRTHVYARTC